MIRPSSSRSPSVAPRPIRVRDAPTSVGLSGGRCTNSKRSGASRNSRRARDTKRVVSTKRFGLSHRAVQNSRSAPRSPGKLWNVRISSTSSSRNVTLPPFGVRASARNAHKRSNAARAARGSSVPGSAAGAWQRVARVTAARKPSGVVAARSISMRSVSGPRRAPRRFRSDVRPIPQPPTTTGIRGGTASSAVRILRSMTGRSAGTRSLQGDADAAT